MSWGPRDFDRQVYLDSANEFETLAVDPASELTEFNCDPEDLAIELAYTRYELTKAEAKLSELEEYVKTLIGMLAAKEEVGR